MPVVFIPHGGGPWPFVEMGIPADQREPLAEYLRGVRNLPPERPSALLVVSGHWEEPVPTVMTSAHPPMYYDYYGFPKESYEITWPAPGQPALAARVQTLLGKAGIDSAADEDRGFDHGTFVPLKLAYPDADVPAIQLSLVDSLDPARHIAIGRALAPLRDEGVFIVASGMTFHNLRAFRNPAAVPVAETFDTWLRESVTLPPRRTGRPAGALGHRAGRAPGSPARGAPAAADGGGWGGRRGSRGRGVQRKRLRPAPVLLPLRHPVNREPEAGSQSGSSS